MTILSFVTLRDGERIVRIEPVTAPIAPTGSELDRLLADAIPHLGTEEAACFEVDIREARAQLDGSERSWD